MGVIYAAFSCASRNVHMCYIVIMQPLRCLPLYGNGRNTHASHIPPNECLVFGVASSCHLGVVVGFGCRRYFSAISPDNIQRENSRVLVVRTRKFSRLFVVFVLFTIRVNFPNLRLFSGFCFTPFFPPVGMRWACDFG